MDKAGRIIVATVECRMTSSRLPGKVMMESCGKPMLELMVERVKRIEKVDYIILATTTNGDDDCIQELADSLAVGCYRGSEEDVLKRVLGAAESVAANVIVELTGDCPLIDPGIVAETVELYFGSGRDYVNNDTPPSYPMGMDVEVFSTDLLRIADAEGTTADDREHVSWFLVRNESRFSRAVLAAPDHLKWPDLRLTLDEKTDFELIDAVFRGLYEENPAFTCEDILAFLRSNPDLLALNRNVVQRNPDGGDE